MAVEEEGSIELQVARYRPDKDCRARAGRSTTYPLRKEWTVLDGLNHVKNEVDTTPVVPLVVPDGHLRQLRDERQRRAPADLRDVPRPTTRPARSGSSRSPTSRSSATWSSTCPTSWQKLPRVKPWIIRDDDVTVIDGEYLQTPEELDAYKQFSMCINCMLCYAACPVYGLDPELHRAGRDRAGRALRPRLPRPGRARAARRPHRARGRLGLHVRRRVHPRVPQARRPGRRHPALQAEGRDRSR